MKLHLVLLGVALTTFGVTSASAQSNGAPEKEIRTSKLLWFDFAETIKFNKKWTLQVEYSPRFNLDPSSVSQNVVRAYALYNVGENWAVGQGFAAFFNNVNDVLVHELRPEQWFFYRQQFERAKRLTVQHRFRLEERFTRKTAGGELVKGYTFTMRYRYRLAFDYTVAKFGEAENPFKVFINDEIFLQSGETIVYNIFDQNRIIAGLSYRIGKGFTVAAAYMNIFRQTRSGNVFDKIHTFRFTISHELALKRKKNK